MKKISIFVFALLLCSYFMAGEATRTAYFAGFPFWESPIQPAKFELPLNQKEAMSRIHIKVTYDLNDRIVDMQVRQGNAFKELGNGLGAMYVHAVHTKISYSENKETHTFYNRFGHQVSGWGEVWEKVYTKDHKNRYVSLDFFNRKGLAIENSWGILRYNWVHGDNGRIIETRVDKKGQLKPHRPGWQFKRIGLVFSPDGQLRVMQNLNTECNLCNAESGAAQYHYYYDSMGKFLRWELFDKDGQPALGPTKTAGEFYTNHRTEFKKITFFGVDGQLTKHDSGAVHWILRYDKHGNMIERSFYDAAEKPIVGTYRYHKLIQTWNETGTKLLKKNLLDADGNPAIHSDGYSSISYTYDERRLLKEQRFIDAKGETVFSSYDKAAVIEFIYDDRGVQVKRLRLDVHGKPVP